MMSMSSTVPHKRFVQQPPQRFGASDVLMICLGSGRAMCAPRAGDESGEEDDRWDVV